MKIGYIFLLNDGGSFESLKAQLSTIKDSNPMWVGVITECKEYYDEIIDILNQYKVNFNVLYNLEKVSDVYKLDQFSKYKNGWTIVRVAGENIVDDADLLRKYISDGNKIALIKEDDRSVNGMCFFNFIYQYLKGSKYELNEETEEVIFKTFEEKVLEKDPNMITTWDKLNEIYYSNTADIYE